MYVKRLFIASFIVSSVVFGGNNQIPFCTLAEPLEKSAAPIEQLSQKPVMEPNREILKTFLEKLRSTLSVGAELSGSNEIDKALLQAYLKDLRELSKTKESIESIYRRSLSGAIADVDKRSFKELLSVPLAFRWHRRQPDGLL